MNFIDLFNMVAKVARSAHAKEVSATAMDETLQDIGIDSLDGLIILMYMTELYGVPDDDENKSFHPVTLQDVYDYLNRRKTREPESVEAAREAIA